MMPLKARLRRDMDVREYLAYTEDCRKLEQNRAIYTL